MSYFPDIIGQKNTKRFLSFQLDAYKSSSFIPPTLLTAKRGGGKTEIAYSMREHLKGSDGNPKPFIEINGATLKNPSGLVSKAIIPYQNTEVTYFIDECHAMDRSVKDFFLTVISLTSERKSRTTFDGMDLDFDFKRQSFLFATTDPQKLTQAFKSRCKRVDLEPYSKKDMQDIVSYHAKKNDIKLNGNTPASIAEVSRNTPREAVSVLNDVRQMCEIKGNNRFSDDDWDALVKHLNIKPFGLTNSEFQVLRKLKEYGEMSLTGLANSLSLNRAAVMNDIEPFLMEMNFIKIDSKRSITNLGIDALNRY